MFFLAQYIIIADNGRSINYRVILNSGSQINTIIKTTIRQLGVYLKTTTMQVQGNANSKNNAQGRISVTVRSSVLSIIVSKQPIHFGAQQTGTS